MLNVKIKLEGLDDVMAIVRPEIYKKAMATTLNRVGTSLRAKTVTEVKKIYNVKAGSLKEKLKETKAFPTKLVWSMDISPTRKLNLMSYLGTAKNDSGLLSAAITKRKRFVLKHAFIGNNGKTVFERIRGTKIVGKKTKYSHTKKGKIKNRERIKTFVGLTPSQMIKERLRIGKVEEAEKKIPQEFRHQLEFYLKKDREK